MLSKLRDLLKPKKPNGQAQPTPTVPHATQSPPSPTSWDELFQQAQSLQQLGQMEKAIEVYGRCVERAPDRPEVYYKRANALNALGQLEPALDSYDRAISLNPSYTYALCNRGSVLERLGRPDEALASYDRAIESNPEDALTHYNRGSVLKRHADALASYERAIEIKADYAEAYVNRGNVLRELRRHEAAVASFDRAIALNPTIALAFQGRALSLHDLSRFEQALAAYNKAIALQPDLASAYVGRAGLLAELTRYSEASTDYLKAIELEPTPTTYQFLATSLLRLKRFDLAIDSLDKATALDPDGGYYLLGTSRSTRMHVCLWDGLGEDLERIARGVSERKPVCDPSMLASLIDSPTLLRSAAEILIRDQIDGSCEEDLARLAEISPASLSRPRSAKIRIGYFSPDFRAHPVAYLTAGLFEHHDRAKFEVTAFAFGPEAKNDAMVLRLTKGFDRFIDVRQKSDLEVAALARDSGIDIAVDLAGFTAHHRTRIFALRAAPAQINFLGYPGTMGAGFIDYLIADGTVVPREQQQHYTEKLAYLPGSFMPFDSTYAIAERTFTREELGLPSHGFVFCCFNNTYKINPEVFDRWMSILGRTGNSVLWLQQADTVAANNLRKEASRRGIDGGRLIFADRMEALDEHVARLRAADLFLDTRPYNAHATAVDALWAGVPLLTYPGESFASRVAASLLRTVGLPELIVNSPSQYEELAVELASDPERLGKLRRKLAMRDAPLFDTRQYTRNLEAAYTAIYERLQAGLPPDHINEHLAT
jgi:predicted O-linked N-acetylglucosamine transferase (SPINDLY family)